MVTVAKGGDTVSVLLHFLSLLSFGSWITTFMLKLLFAKGRCFVGPWLVPYLSFGTAGKWRGVTMAVCGVGGHSMGHLPPQEEDGEQDKLEAL